MPAVKRLVDASCSADKTFRPMEGVYHEMLFEPEKEEVIRIVSEWVLERASKTKARL
jgi:alpha-beta hydrolase superfamily lysophospholipase